MHMPNEMVILLEEHQIWIIHFRLWANFFLSPKKLTKKRENNLCKRIIHEMLISKLDFIVAIL
jgi:hypothetical protein